jgi:hypothetical protein
MAHPAADKNLFPPSSTLGLMCGRYRRRSDKQRIAETFHVGIGLDELYLEPRG